MAVSKFLLAEAANVFSLLLRLNLLALVRGCQDFGKGEVNLAIPKTKNKTKQKKEREEQLGHRSTGY